MEIILSDFLISQGKKKSLKPKFNCLLKISHKLTAECLTLGQAIGTVGKALV